MRTIKFRGKRLDNGAWETGGVVPVNVGTSAEKWYISCKHTGSVSGNYGHGVLLSEVDPETIGQFTGLLDKDGKEIYDGDILKYDNPYIVGGSICSIEYRLSSFGFIPIKGKAMNEFNPLCCIHGLESKWKKNISIIGNIHDNPEHFNRQTK